MKIRYILTQVLVLISLIANATIIDLTTGTGAIGSSDPIWEVMLPGATGCDPITITTGVLEDSGHTYENAYCQDACGKWISPYVNASYNIIRTGTLSGYFTYKRAFVLDNCISPKALLNFDFMAADNEIVEIRVNGIPYPLPGTITHLMCDLTMSDVIIDVTPGLNTVEVVVDNYSAYTALQLCGEITVFDEETIPDGLHCCLAPAGQLLSWSSIPGAIGYEVEITWNDPVCCGEVGDVTVEVINTTDNILIIPSETDCFSWKVKAIYPGCESEYSYFSCSCGDYCFPPSILGCKYTIEGDVYLDWNDVPLADGYQVAVVFNDPACCHFGGPTLGSIYPVMTGSSLLIDFYDTCFSWRVRTVCQDGSFSEWSELQCSCSPGAIGQILESDSTNVEMLDFVVMPNPVNDVIYVNSEYDEYNQAQLQMHDVNGNVIYEGIISQNRHSIQVDQLLEGMYTISVLKGGIITTKKVIVKH